MEQPFGVEQLAALSFLRHGVSGLRGKYEFALPFDKIPLYISSLTALLTPIYVEEYNRIPPIPCLNPFAAMVTVSALHHHIYEFRSQLSTYTGAGLPVPIYRPGSEERLRDGFEGRKQVSGCWSVAIASPHR
jgi:hypothetical protein